MQSACHSRGLTRVLEWIAQCWSCHLEDLDHRGVVAVQALMQEYACGNVPTESFEKALVKFDKTLNLSSRGDHSALFSFPDPAHGSWNLPAQPTMPDCGYVVLLMRADHFVSHVHRKLMIDDWSPGARPMYSDAEMIQQVKTATSNLHAAIDYSRMLADCGRVKLSGKKPQIWVLNATELLGTSDLFGLDPTFLFSCIQKLGLAHFWVPKAALPLGVVAIRMPCNSLTRLGIPTVWHTTGLVWRPYADRITNWGRTVDLATFDWGVPEAVHKELAWSDQFVPCWASEISSQVREMTQADWKEWYSTTARLTGIAVDETRL